VAHDVVVDLLALDIHRGFAVLSGDAETAVQVALVALEGGQDVIVPRGSRLVGLKNGEDGGEDVRDEVVQQSLVTLVELDGDVWEGGRGTTREVEEVHIQGVVGDTAYVVSLTAPRF